MDEAPTPKPFMKKVESLDLNEIDDKKEYIHEGYKITLGLYNDYLFLFVNSNNDNNCFQLKSTYEELIEKIPNFKMLKDPSELLSLMQQLFEANKYYIKKEGEILKVIIKIKNMLDKDEEYELILRKVELNDKERMKIMEEKIKNLENNLKAFY